MRTERIRTWLSPHSATSPWPTATGPGTATPPRSASAPGPRREDEPNEKYRDAHVWYDADAKENFTAYKLLIADVIDGRLKAVPRGVFAAAAVMQGSRGGVDVPDKDRDRIKSHLAKYYAKLDETPPWDD